MNKFFTTSIRWPAALKADAEKVAGEEDRTFSSLVMYATRLYVTERLAEIEKTKPKKAARKSA